MERVIRNYYFEENEIGILDCNIIIENVRKYFGPYLSSIDKLSADVNKYNKYNRDLSDDNQRLRKYMRRPRRSKCCILYLDNPILLHILAYLRPYDTII